MAKAATKTSGTSIAPIMVLAGEELFLRNGHLAEIRQAVFGKEDPGLSLVRFSEAAPMAEILDECRTLSMFASRKLVIVDPADTLLKPAPEEPAGKKRPSLTNRELLENYLESQSDKVGEEPAAVLVLVCTSWLKTTRLHKALDKVGAVRWCEAMKEYQVPSWLTKRAREAYGKALEPAAAARLADLIGPDLQRLDNELAKLALYKPESPAISTQAVDALVGFQHEQEIWDMINAMADKNAPAALKKIDELWQLDPKNMDYAAIGAVNYWLGQVLKARELVDRRMSDGLISRELKLWPEDRARKVLSLARQWGLPGAARWSRELLSVDMANKSSLGTPRHNLEKFVVQLCS